MACLPQHGSWLKWHHRTPNIEVASAADLLQEVLYQRQCNSARRPRQQFCQLQSRGFSEPKLEGKGLFAGEFYKKLLGARTRLGVPGLTTRNKKLLGAKGISTRSKDTTLELFWTLRSSALLSSALSTQPRFDDRRP